MAAMKMKLLSVLFAPLLLLSDSAAAAAFAPRDHYLIKCGFHGDGAVIDSDNRVFTADDYRFIRNLKTVVDIRSADSNLVSSPLYRTARAFRSSGAFVFPLKDRGVHHLVRLHFYPTEGSLFESEFHVFGNGFLLLANFRIPRRTDLLPMIKEFIIPPISDVLRISFVPSKPGLLSFVNAIEVISAPADLIPDSAQFIDVDKNERINGLLRSGFETVYRINVGGFKITPFNDTLWRTWLTDDEFLISGKTSESIHFSAPIQYRIGGPSHEVSPDGVYNTARVIRSSSSSTSVPTRSMTWSFPVEQGQHPYMARLHFCDIASIALDTLYFNVRINGNPAYTNLDLSTITGRQLASPFYADFVVDTKNTTTTSSRLTVTVGGPSDMSLPGSVDAILNGIEIFKMMNSGGGESRSDRRNNKVIIIFSGLVVILSAVMWLMVALVLTSERRKKMYQGWSRVPLTS